MDHRLTAQEASMMFRALGDPRRLEILRRLQQCGADQVQVDERGQVRPAGSLCVGEVCCDLRVSPSNASHHLRELRLAGLIRMEKRGRWIYCSVCQDSLAALSAWMLDAANDPLCAGAPE